MEDMHRYRVWLLASLGVVAVAGVVAGAGLLVWRGPWWFDGSHLDNAKLKDGSAALVTGFRTAVVQLLAVLGAGIALLFTAFNYRLTRRGQVTDRFTKALERLGSPEMYVRIGGILALEQIVQDAPDQADHAAQVLNAFVRHHTPRCPAVPAATGGRDRITTARRNARTRTTPPVTPSLPEQPAADVQQALTALTRPISRRHATTRPDLHDLHLPGAQLPDADLTGARLDGANLTGAQLTRATLTNGRLDGVNLTGARLDGADFTEARLNRAKLTDAQLEDAVLTNAQLIRSDLTNAWLHSAVLPGAMLSGADLSGAQFTSADLAHARLTDAKLIGTQLSNADFSGAKLVGADLTNALLRGTDLSGASLGSANLSGVQLDSADLRTCEGLTLEQVLSTASINPNTRLPPDIAAHPDVTHRLTPTPGTQQ